VTVGKAESVDVGLGEDIDICHVKTFLQADEIKKIFNLFDWYVGQK